MSNEKGSDQGEGAGQSAGDEGAKGGTQDTKDTLDLLVGGEKHSVSREEAIRLAQMGMDYTRKTQSLAAEREKFAELVESKAQEIYRQALERSGQGADGDGEAAARKDPELLKKLEDLEKRVSSYDQNSRAKEAEAQLDGILSNLRKNHPSLTDEDETLIMIRFNKEANSEADPVALFEAYAKERASYRDKQRQSIIDEYVKTKTRDPFASGESGRSGSAGASKTAPAKTFEEARERAEARLNGGI